MTSHPDEGEYRWSVYRHGDVWVSSPPMHHGGGCLPRDCDTFAEAITDADRRARLFTLPNTAHKGGA
ncbi:hypothetical protein SCMU_13960 [Sinomonas cyclohexanicum]|uniref:DUF397 domain-containing protein n=1 Tax=Sinomonas cyclohexanicum TaxID=322009 RepID=A0ABM7PU18_SINCY|nr:hypothetical protein SCMU_13960 [Corynebacterium cyclohexanicum]